MQLAQIGSDVFVIWNVADEPCGGVLDTLKWLECRLRKFRPYRSYHSTETAILKVMSDIFLALDSGDLAILPLLDLSATFDTVDHYILLKRLNISYRISHSVLGWLPSYLNNRTQFVQLNGSCSTSSVVTCGVPQGLVLGPILFFYTPQTSPDWWTRTTFRSICTRTTHRCTLLSYRGFSKFSECRFCLYRRHICEDKKQEPAAERRKN